MTTQAPRALVGWHGTSYVDGVVAQWVRTKEGAHLAGRRNENTDPEVLLRRAVHAAGGRFRLHRRIAKGCTPDFVLPGRRVAVFVDGCFWHNCPVHGRKREWTGPNAELWAKRCAEMSSEISGRRSLPKPPVGPSYACGSVKFGAIRLPPLDRCWTHEPSWAPPVITAVRRRRRPTVSPGHQPLRSVDRPKLDFEHQLELSSRA